MRSHLLSEQDFSNLQRASTTVEAWSLLRKSAHADTLPEVPPADSLMQECALRNACALRFQRCIRRLHGRATSVGQLLLSRWDLDNVELALRYWHGRDRSAAHVRSLPTMVNHIPFGDLLDAETMGQVIASLSDTPYAGPIARTAGVYKEKQSIFYVELALEKDYYGRLLAATRALGGPDARDGLAALGAEIDAVNLMLLARLMHSGHMDAREWPALIVPGPSALSRQLAAAAIEPADLARVHADYLVRLIPGGHDESGSLKRLAMLESIVHEMTVAWARRVFSHYPFRVSGVFAYDILIRNEMKNLCAVFASRAAGHSPNDGSAALRVAG